MTARFKSPKPALGQQLKTNNGWAKDSFWFSENVKDWQSSKTKYGNKIAQERFQKKLKTSPAGGSLV